MHFRATIEGAECLRRNDAGWQSVPDAWYWCSDEKFAIYSRHTTWWWADVDTSYWCLTGCVFTQPKKYQGLVMPLSECQ